MSKYLIRTTIGAVVVLVLAQTYCLHDPLDRVAVCGVGADWQQLLEGVPDCSLLSRSARASS